MKSKRHCQGYDPVFQPQGPHSLHPAPNPHTSGSQTSPTVSTQNRHYSVSSAGSTSNHGATITTSSPRSHSDFSFSRPPEQLLPHINQPYKMDSQSPSGLPAYSSTGRRKLLLDRNSQRLNTDVASSIIHDILTMAIKHSIEEICTFPGSTIPTPLPIPKDSVPNLEPIRKVYDIAFAPGLDKLLDSGSSKWYTRHGFRILSSDRHLLGLMLAYLTLVGNNSANSSSDIATLASQEARITWALLGLCIRADNDGGEDADRLARRFKALEAILTGDPLTSTASTSMADFVHQDEPEPEVRGSAFEKQLAKRSDEFWKAIETAARSQRRIQTQKDDTIPNPNDNENLTTAITQCRGLLDGMENRDIIYSILLQTQSTPPTPNPSSSSDGTISPDRAREKDLAKRFLQSQADGRATNQVFSTIASMAIRAFET